MKKAETKLMETLSMSLFGKKYHWRKLTNKGVMTVQQEDGKQFLRRTKLTKDQARSFMIKKIEARQQTLKDMEPKAQEATDESNKQSDTSERNNDDTGSES